MSSPRLTKTFDTSVFKAKAKIQDVARLAEVSLGTVSAVLNGKGRVSTATRDRVQAAIVQLNYRPDLYASNLARRNTQILGVIVSNLENPFFAETANAVEIEAERHGFQISLMATNFSPVRHRSSVERMLGARIAGLAVLTSEHDEQSRKLILASGIPSVFLDYGSPTESSATIRVDSGGGMRLAVEHLLALGHRDFLFVRNSHKGAGPPLLSHRLRDEGFAAAVQDCNVPGVHAHAIDTEGPGADAGEKAIAQALGSIRFTAAVAVTDTVAMGMYRGLQARGLSIPKDVSVVGFDNTYFCRFLHPPLTTVDIPRTELSRAVLAALLRKGESCEELSSTLATSLIVRQSTGPPNRQSKSMA